MTALALSVLCGFAVWRIASMLHTEDAFEWLRAWIGIENDDKGFPVLYPDTWLGRTFDCFMCLSWVVAAPFAAVAVVLSGIHWPWGLFFIWPVASAVAILVERKIMGSHAR